MDSARWLELGEPLVSLRLGGRRGVAAILILAVLAGWTGHPAAVFLVLGLLALVGLAWCWAERALVDVHCWIETREDRAFPDDLLRALVVARNEKALPISWLRARGAVPPALTPAGTPRRWPYADRGGYLQGMAALAWYSQVSWEFDLPCRRRGVYQLGPLEITSGDPFGLFSRRVVLPEQKRIVIYPRVVPLRRLGFPLPVEPGASRRRRTLQDDPVRTAGVREYQPGDPLRRIHWPATARQGGLQVRILEPAAAPMLMLILAGDTFDFPWSRYRDDVFELAVSALGSIAWRAIEDGWSVGLAVGGTSTVSLPPAASQQQLGQILEALARAEPAARLSLTELLFARGGAVRNATYVLATGRATNALLESCARLNAAHHPMVLLYGDEPPTSGPRLSAYRLREWGDLASTLEGPGELVGGR